jgi:hypothetical protein
MLKFSLAIIIIMSQWNKILLEFNFVYLHTGGCILAKLIHCCNNYCSQLVAKSIIENVISCTQRQFLIPFPFPVRWMKARLV